MPTSRLTTADLAALDDTQLAQVLEQNRRSDGAYELCVVDDWTKLSKEERDGLAKRLQTISTNSRPLDLDKLDERLRDVTDRDNSPSQALLRARERETESPDETPQEVYMRNELEGYNNLVQDGGRPLYPIEMLELVSRDPTAHREMLLPFWRGSRPNFTMKDGWDPRDVFSRQWLRWENFRKWQLDNRRIEEVDDGFLSFVEKTVRSWKEVGWGARAAEIEANPASLKKPGSTWDSMQRHRDWQRRYQREPKCKSFSEYEEAVKARLSRHGFTWSFHLAEDPKQQSKLATWAEYLGFEYWWLDRCVQSVERLKPNYDEAWEELTKTGVLQEDETLDFLHSGALTMRTQADKDHTWKAVKDAEFEAEKAYQMTQMDPDHLSIPKNRRIQMLVQAANKLAAARDAFNLARRRSVLIVDFIIGSRDYINAKEDVVNQTNLVNWVLGEAHAIEDEQNPATLLTNSRKKRKIPPEGVCSERSDVKGQRSRRNPCLSNSTVVAGEGRVLRSRHRPSTNVSQQLVSQQRNDASAVCPIQTELVRPAVQQVYWTKAGAELATAEGISQERKKVAFKDASLIQTRSKRRKSNARADGNSVDTPENKVLVTPNRPRTHKGRKARRTTPDSHMQSSIPGRAAHQVTQGLRRSARLARLRLGEAGYSVAHK